MGHASCCLAMIFTEAYQLPDISHYLRGDFLKALRDPSANLCRDNLRLFSFLEPLPRSWDAWPEDSKAACPKEAYDTHTQRWRCKMVTSKGLCSIHPRRPYICLRFQPNDIGCAYCSSYLEGNCCPKI